MPDAATLRNLARCYDCEIPAGMFMAVMAYILQATIDGTTVSADPAVLANAARCYDCVGVTPGMIIELLVSLNIEGGGGGGGNQVLQDATGGPPPDPLRAAISFPTGGGTISQWDVNSQSWV